jgi:phosphoglycerol transferase MdoB-like AlkP superfamily enzyme
MQTLKEIFLHGYKRNEVLGTAGILQWILGALALVVWSAGLGMVCLFFAKANYGRALFDSYLQIPLTVVLNLLPVLFVTLLIFLLSNRIWISVVLSGAFFSVVTFINYFKIGFRGDPLLVSDAIYIQEAADMGGKYAVTLTPGMWLTFAAILVCSVLSFFLLRAHFRSWKPRLLTLAVLIAAGAVLYPTVFRSEAVYERTSNLNVELPDKDMSAWSATDNYVCRGFVYPLVYSTRDLTNRKPEGFKKSEAAALLNSYAYDDIPEGQKVSVISVMLEAYNDLSSFGSLEFNTDPYTFFHKLQKESLSGQLVTNIFAGGTIDTERCFLTGSTEMYEYRGDAGSYARYFNEQGYYTEFCHPGYNWFYNRDNVAEYLGFQASHFNNDLFAMPWEDTIMNDDSVFPLLIDQYGKAAAGGTPYFNFTVTYQNHGPYAEDYLYDQNNEYIRDTGLSDGAYNILNNYFWGINVTDMALESFIGHFRELDEPVVIVLFGDHNPWLGDNSYVYEELGIDLSRSSDKSFYDYYHTPYVIWANDAAKEALDGDFSGDGGDFSPFLLMPRLFDECGWGGNQYMKACRDLRELLDVVHITGAVRENGELTSSPSPDAAAALNKLLKLQYYWMRDAY